MLLAVAVVAVAVAAGAPAFAADDDTILVGVTADRGPQYGKKLVIKSNGSPYVGPPVQLPDEPGEPPKQPGPGMPSAHAGLDSGNGLGGGVGMIASASPQTRIENSLKDLARDLR